MSKKARVTKQAAMLELLAKIQAGANIADLTKQVESMSASTAIDAGALKAKIDAAMLKGMPKSIAAYAKLQKYFESKAQEIDAYISIAKEEFDAVYSSLELTDAEKKRVVTDLPGRDENNFPRIIAASISVTERAMIVHGEGFERASQGYIPDPSLVKSDDSKREATRVAFVNAWAKHDQARGFTQKEIGAIAFFLGKVAKGNLPRDSFGVDEVLALGLVPYKSAAPSVELNSTPS
jgi:hypothetical protein